MTTYQELDHKLNEITIILKENNVSEYTNTVEIDGIFYKRSIKKLKHKPKNEY